MRKLLIAAMLAAVLGLPSVVQAQNYPDRPLTMIIPFAASGPTDVLGRVMAQRMSEILGQQVVVENVGDAGGQPAHNLTGELPPLIMRRMLT